MNIDGKLIIEQRDKAVELVVSLGFKWDEKRRDWVKSSMTIEEQRCFDQDMARIYGRKP